MKEREILPEFCLLALSRTVRKVESNAGVEEKAAITVKEYRPVSLRLQYVTKQPRQRVRNNLKFTGFVLNVKVVTLHCDHPTGKHVERIVHVVKLHNSVVIGHTREGGTPNTRSPKGEG